MFVFFLLSFVAKYDKSCACIVSHTYKQIRKLWENPDKMNANQNGMNRMAAGIFDADIDRSTSSSTGWYLVYTVTMVTKTN